MGGSAIFANDTSDIHSGTNALSVTVKNPGTASNSVQLASSFFTASSADTYVLRFWASTSVSHASLGINLNGATPFYPQIPFEVSTNADSYQEYLYAFKASGNVSIAFNFQTAAEYWLDDVEVLDLKNNDGFDIPMTYLWQWGQLNYSKTNSTGWGGGDNEKSALLPDGSVAWIFNDSYASTLDSFYSNIRGNSSLPRNCVVHQVGTNLYWMNNEANTCFVPTNPADIYWIGDSIAESNKLLVLLNGLNNSPLSNVCMAVATLSLPGLTLDGITNLTSPGTDNFGSFVKGDDGYYYIYNGPKVARVPVGSLSVDSAWRFWNGSTWVTDHIQSVGLPNLVNPWSTIRLGTSNYVTIYFPPYNFTDITAQYAPTPMGPWSSGVTVAQAASQWAEIMYAPNICAGTGSNGIYTISYSDNGSPENWFSKTASDKSWYNPHFVTANLLAPSPYNSPNGPDLALDKTVVVSSTDNSSDLGSYAVDGNFSTRWSSAYSDSQWIYADLGSTQSIGQVRLYWETAYGSSYQIQVSNDASTWTTVYRTTNGAGGYENINFAPVSARYVRMYGTQRGTVFGYSLYEFQIFPPASPMLGALTALPSGNVNTGASATLVCSNYTGMPPYGFQWQASGDGISYTNVTAATSNQLALPVVTANSPSYYQLVFTADDLSVTSSVVQLMVNPPPAIGLRAGAGSVVLNWPQGTLLQATNLLGPWTTNPATSPYTGSLAGSQCYFRLQLP